MRSAGPFLLLFLLSFPFTLQVAVQGRPVNVGAADLAAGALFLVLLLQRERPSIRGMLAEVPFPVWIILGAGLSSWAVYASGAGVPPDQRPSSTQILLSAKELLQYAEILLFGYLVFRHLPRPDTHPFWAGTAVGLMALMAGLVAFQAAQDSALVPNETVCGAGLLDAPAPGGLRVAFGYSNHHAYGNGLALVVPLGLAILLFGRFAPHRAAGGLLLALTPFTLLSGGPLLGIAAAALFLAGRRGAAGIASAVALLVLYAAVGDRLLPRKNFKAAIDSIAVYEEVRESDGRSRAAPTARYPRLQAVLNLIAARPVFGVGPGAYTDRVRDFYGLATPSPRPVTRKEHNTQPGFGVAAADLGLPGLLALLALVLGLIRDAAEGAARAPDPTSRAVLLGAAAALLALLPCSVFSNILTRETGLWLAFLMALVRAEERRSLREG